MSNLVQKVATGAISFALVLGLVVAPVSSSAALTSSQISSILSLLSSFGADQATINNVNASLLGQPTSGTGTTTGGSTTSSCSFTGSLTMGSKGTQVTCLQNALIAAGYSIPAGATGYFGAQTQTAVAAWQKAVGVSPAAGYFGPLSQAKFNMSGGTPTVPGTPITGNGLKAMLASDSPNNVALVQGQAIGELAKFTFQNPTGSAVSITSLGFKRIGASSDSTVSNIYLYNGATRLTDSAGLSNTAFTFNNASGVVTVPAMGSVTVSVRADIAASTNGQQVGAQLVSIGTSAALDSSVVLPITGGLQTISSASIATVAVTYNGTTGGSVNPANDERLFQANAVVSTRAASLQAVTFENRGSADDNDLTNLRLMVDGVQVGSAMPMFVNDKVTFDLSSSPVRLETGTRVIKVMGDIVGGSSETFDVQIRKAADIRVIDTELGQPILITGTWAAAAANTINAGSVSVVRAANSPNSNISVDATNVKLGSFEFRAVGENVKIETITVDADTSVHVGGLDNGKVFLNGVQVGSTLDIAEGASTEFNFGSSFILTQGATAIVDIYADAKTTTGTSLSGSETVDVGVSFAAADTEGMDSGNTVTAVTEVEGFSITVSALSATLTKASGYGNQTMIAGTNNAKLGSFTISAGSTEGVSVNTLTVTLSSDEAATITDLKLVDSTTGTQLGTTKVSPSTSNAFSVSFTIPASGTKTIDIIANIKSSVNAGAWTAAVDGSGNGSTNAGTATFGSSSTALQTITIGSAVLTAAENTGSTPDSANVIAGSSMVKVGSFRFTSQYSSYTVQELKVKIPADAATSVSSVTLKFKDAAGTDQTVSQALSLSSGAEAYATATYTGLSFFIPTNTDRDLDVYVSIPTIASGASTGKAISAVLDFNEGFKAVDSSGTSDTSLAAADLNSAATSGKGSMYVRKSLPVLSKVALDTTALSAGSNKTIGRVKITADAAGDIGWKKLSFTVNKTSALTLGATTTVALWDGSNQVAGVFGTTTAAMVGGLDSLVNSTSGNLTFVATSEQQIAAGTSKTYELRTTIGAIGSGYNFVNVTIANPTTSVSTDTASTIGITVASTPSFTWTDRSSITTVHSESTSDWTNDYLIDDLILDLGTLSVTI